MVRMTIEMPAGALAAMRKDPSGFAADLRVAAAVIVPLSESVRLGMQAE